MWKIEIEYHNGEKEEFRSEEHHNVAYGMVEWELTNEKILTIPADSILRIIETYYE